MLFRSIYFTCLLFVISLCLLLSLCLSLYLSLSLIFSLSLPLFLSLSVSLSVSLSLTRPLTVPLSLSLPLCLSYFSFTAYFAVLGMEGVGSKSPLINSSLLSIFNPNHSSPHSEKLNRMSNTNNGLNMDDDHILEISQKDQFRSVRTL